MNLGMNTFFLASESFNTYCLANFRTIALQMPKQSNCKAGPVSGCRIVCVGLGHPVQYVSVATQLGHVHS